MLRVLFSASCGIIMLKGVRKMKLWMKLAGTALIMAAAAVCAASAIGGIASAAEPGAGAQVAPKRVAPPKAEALAQAPRREVPVGEKTAAYTAMKSRPFW